jgi:hypothetical protein
MIISGILSRSYQTSNSWNYLRVRKINDAKVYIFGCVDDTSDMAVIKATSLNTALCFCIICTMTGQTQPSKVFKNEVIILMRWIPEQKIKKSNEQNRYNSVGTTSSPTRPTNRQERPLNSDAFYNKHNFTQELELVSWELNKYARLSVPPIAVGPIARWTPGRPLLNAS